MARTAPRINPSRSGPAGRARAGPSRGVLLALSCACAASFLFVCLAAPSARANFERVGEFPSGTEVKLTSVPKGLATNFATGDVYESDGLRNRVLRFTKEGKFLEAWGWGVGDGLAQYERCGPSGEVIYPTCPGQDGEGRGLPGTEPGQFQSADDLAVDQANGNVFVINESTDWSRSSPRRASS